MMSEWTKERIELERNGMKLAVMCGNLPYIKAQDYSDALDEIARLQSEVAKLRSQRDRLVKTFEQMFLATDVDESWRTLVDEITAEEGKE